MKIRNGFVSNSSSSSFMIGIAKIVDMDKFKKWFDNFGDKLKYDCFVFSAKEEFDDYRIKKNSKGDYIVESFLGSQVSIKAENLKNGDNIFIVDIVPNEGDCCFRNIEYEDYELNYNIDIDFFEQHYQDVYNGMNKNNGLDFIDICYGAGRNG